MYYHKQNMLVANWWNVYYKDRYCHFSIVLTEKLSFVSSLVSVRSGMICPTEYSGNDTVKLQWLNCKSFMKILRNLLVEPPSHPETIPSLAWCSSWAKISPPLCCSLFICQWLFHERMMLWSKASLGIKMHVVHGQVIWRTKRIFQDIFCKTSNLFFRNIQNILRGSCSERNKVSDGVRVLQSSHIRD